MLGVVDFNYFINPFLSVTTYVKVAYLFSNQPVVSVKIYSIFITLGLILIVGNPYKI